MKINRARLLLCATFAWLATLSSAVHAQAPAENKAAKPAKAAPTQPPQAQPQQAQMDPKQAAAMEKMMEAWQKFATPGPQHQALKDMTGTWTAAVKMWMDPKAPPQETTGKATSKMIFGDRYLVDDYTGSMMGQAFTGMAITGYDNGLKKYMTFWIDSMGTGFFTGEGTADKTGKVITFKTKGTDPMTGKTVQGRQVLTIESDKRHVMEMYEKKGGKEIKMMEIVYTR